MERKRLSWKIACIPIVIVVCVIAGALFMPHKFIKDDAEIEWLKQKCRGVMLRHFVV